MLGIEIYTDYLYPLQVAAVLLLVAIIAAIALTLRRRKDSSRIDPSQQVGRARPTACAWSRCARRSKRPSPPPPHQRRVTM
jgi:NADH-quinone oxidoreductase subunit J